MKHRNAVTFALVSLAALLLAAPARACLNDRDTLAEEIKGLPDITRIITGRFERNPPLYYEMRIKRIGASLPSHPDTLNDYDDIAVALDRVGRDDEAIGWEEKKRARLVALHVSDTDPATKENWYRYYANCGTCWVHRWLRHGADRTKIAQVKTARDMIARAIVIKPGAHEGREKYQLLVMDWIIQPRAIGTPSTNRNTLAYVASWQGIRYSFRAQPKGNGGEGGDANSDDESGLLKGAADYLDQGLTDQPVDLVERAERVRVSWSGSKELADKDDGFEAYDTIGASAYAMRWFRNGADPSAIADLRKAVALVNSRDSQPPLQPNTSYPKPFAPPAPIRAVDVAASALRLPEVSLMEYVSPDHEAPRATLDGMSGLVVLGSAWESIDVFDCIAAALSRQYPHKSHLSAMVWLRVRELKQAGHRSLGSIDVEPPPDSMNEVSSEDTTAYRSLRSEADEWEKKRTAYMMARLSAGRHPDTDSTFWSDWHDSGPPVPAQPVGEMIRSAAAASVQTGVLFVTIPLIVAIAARSLSIRRRQLAKSTRGTKL